MELQICPECGTSYPDYRHIDEGGLYCDYCGYWSADPEPHDCPEGCVGHEGLRYREIKKRRESNGRNR